MDVPMMNEIEDWKQAAAVTLPLQVYDMALPEIIGDGLHQVDLSPISLHDGKTKKVRLHVPSHYSSTYKVLSHEMGISKTTFLANCLKIGTCTWGHNYHGMLKKYRDIRRELYYKDNGAYEEIFDKTWHVFPQEDAGSPKDLVNVIAGSKDTVPLINEFSDVLGISQSEFSVVMLAVCLVRFGLKKIPENKFDRFSADICTLSQRQKIVMDACERAL
jgi:hypothetical protein